MHGVAYRFGRFVLDSDTQAAALRRRRSPPLAEGVRVAVDPARRVSRAPFRRPSCRSVCGRRPLSKRRTWRVSSQRFAARFAIPPRGRCFCGPSIASAIGLSATSWRPTNRRAPATAGPADRLSRLREPADAAAAGRQRHRPRARRSRSRAMRPACRGITRALWCRRTTRRWKIWGARTGRICEARASPSARLADGDEIRLGMASLTFRLMSALEPTDTVAIERTGD